MSLLLRGKNTTPGLEAKTLGMGILQADVVFLGEYEIGIKDFLALTEYVLTNSNLYLEDPRLDFVEKMKSVKKVEGWGGQGEHLEIT